MSKIFSDSIAAVFMNKRLIIRALLTMSILGIILYIVRMLFFYTPNAAYKDILNVIIGALLGQLPTVMNFWFKKDDDDQKEERGEKELI